MRNTTRHVREDEIWSPCAWTLRDTTIKKIKTVGMKPDIGGVCCWHIVVSSTLFQIVKNGNSHSRHKNSDLVFSTYLVYVGSRRTAAVYKTWSGPQRRN